MGANIGVALIGCGGIALANHVPGLALCKGAQLVALCDADAATLARASSASGVSNTYTDYALALQDPAVDAVIVTTPNYLHAPIAHAAISAGKHVLCEKPLAMTFPESLALAEAAEAAGVRHMTAFTYRFVPAMRYMTHLASSGAIGQPYHFRASRFQDWGERPLGWRQVQRLAGSGELGDMLSHRIDYGHQLVGPIARLVGHTRRFIDTRGGLESDLEDWVAIIAQFAAGATGVLESSKLATGRGQGMRSHDLCELNGSEATLMYQLTRPNELLVGRREDQAPEMMPVPEEFLVHPASPRDPRAADAATAFRFDQDVEFIDAIANGRPCEPSFFDGARTQAVIDAVLQSSAEGRWVDVPQVTR